MEGSRTELVLKGKKALVTGGTRGIGAAIALRLVEMGAEVTVTGTKPDGIAPSGCSYCAINFTDSQAVKSLAGKVTGDGYDILVNNAGINKIGAFSDYDFSDFAAIQRVNVEAPFLLCQALVPGMVRKRWGRIVNISSIFGKISRAQRAAYSASKFALDGMSLALALEVARDGVLVNCVAPGFIETDLTLDILGEKGMKDLADSVPIGRLGRPDEVAAFVCWLAGPENTFLTGQNIAIDGGFSRV